MLSLIQSAIRLDDTGDPSEIATRIRERCTTMLSMNIRPKLRRELTTLANVSEARLTVIVSKAMDA